MWFKRTAKHLYQVWEKGIWESGRLSEALPRRCLFALLRVASITIRIFRETHAASRAAALSFSSMLGLGPLIAIATMVAGFVMGKGNQEGAVKIIDRLFDFLTPQIKQFDRMEGPKTGLPDLIKGFETAANHPSAGIVGAITLIIIVLTLFKSIEDAFNEIWGVRRGRNWFARMFFYWCVLTLGALGFFASVTLLSAAAFVNVVIGRLPFGVELIQLLRWSVPVLSFVLLVGALGLFYRLTPATKVNWSAALAGAGVVAILLLFNNFLAFVYLKRVFLTRSLYGSLGIIPVLMFGLYIFWLYLLIGGQISYAVQNYRQRQSQIVWSNLGVAVRERLCLALFLHVCRRMRNGEPPEPASELGRTLPIPAQILNLCLGQLADMKLLKCEAPDPEAGPADKIYIPARPLDQITLYDFKEAAEHLGEDPLDVAVLEIEPLVQRFNQAQEALAESPTFRLSVEELLSCQPRS